MCHDALKCAVLYCVVDQVVLGIRLLAELIWILSSSCLNPWLAQSWPQSKRAGRSTSLSSRSDSVPKRDEARGGPERRPNTNHEPPHKTPHGRPHETHHGTPHETFHETPHETFHETPHETSHETHHGTPPGAAPALPGPRSHVNYNRFALGALGTHVFSRFSRPGALGTHAFSRFSRPGALGTHVFSRFSRPGA